MKLNIKAIKKIMVANGWSQNDLADHSGLTRTGISYIFKKEACRLQSASKIAAALGVEIEEIWGE